jgi:hypothetical protein
MSRAEQAVESLRSQAAHATDPERLRQTAAKLRAWGAWQDAEKAERKALDAERRMAEEVNA